jgi:hypothetical protein
MADTKISALTSLSSVDVADEFAVVDVSATETKQVTLADLMTSMAARMIRGEAVSGSGTSFTLANTPIANTLQLYRGGIRITVAGGDYTIVSAAITLSSSLETGNTLTADYQY